MVRIVTEKGWCHLNTLLRCPQCSNTMATMPVPTHWTCLSCVIVWEIRDLFGKVPGPRSVVEIDIPTDAGDDQGGKDGGA